MGAAVAIDMCKPVDASDIRSSQSLSVAKDEIIRLRGLLGHMAKDYGINSVVYDASDLVLGEDEQADFERCVKDIAHIRGCLHLSTQTSLRSNRKYARTALPAEEMDSDDGGSSSEDECKSSKK